MSLACSCLNIDAIDKYSGHTTICILRQCQTVLALSKNRESNSTICITKTKPMLMFLMECLKNASENNNIVRQIVDVLICHELWLLNDDDITRLLLKGTKTIITQSNRWNDISLNIFIDFCVSKVRTDIDVPTMGLLQLLSEHDVTKDVVLRQYGCVQAIGAEKMIFCIEDPPKNFSKENNVGQEILPKIVCKLIDWTMSTKQSTPTREQLQQIFFSILRNLFKYEESETGSILFSDNKRIKTFHILTHQWKDFMWASISLLDSTKSASLKCDILDFLRELCRLDVFVIESLKLVLKDELLILELLCVCKRRIQEKFTDQKVSGNNGAVSVVTPTMLQLKVLAVLIDLMKTYTKITNARHYRKISSIPEYILRSDIVFFVRSTAMITNDNDLFSATIEFFSLLTSTPTFSSNRRMLEVLEHSFGVVFMICRNKSFDPQSFVKFAMNVLKQHHINQNFLTKDYLAMEPTLQIQKQIIGVFSVASTHANSTHLLQYAKLLSFCSSSEVCDSLWGLLVDFTKKLTESATRSLTSFKIVLIIADALMKWNRFISVFGVHYPFYGGDSLDRSVEKNIISILNNRSVIPYILAFIEVASPLEDVGDSVYIEIIMKLIKLSVKLCGFKRCDKRSKQTSRVKVLLNEDNRQSVEVVVPSTAKTSEEDAIITRAECWTADSVMFVLELLQSKGRMCNEWFEIMAFVVVATVKEQMPWYSVEKDLSFFYGWKLFDAVKGLCEYTKKRYCDDEIKEIIELTRGKSIAFGMAELAVIYVTEMLSPIRRNRDYFSANLKKENGFVAQVLCKGIHQDYILFFYKTFLYVIANWDAKDTDNAMKYFPKVTQNFTEIVSTLQSCDIPKIVTFESSFFWFLFQNTTSEFIIAKLVEAWMKQDNTEAAKFLHEICCDVKQSLNSSDMVEACVMHMVESGEPDCSNLAFGILTSKRKLHNWDNLLNIFNALIQKIVDQDERLSLLENSNDIGQIPPNLLNFGNIMKLITSDGRNKNMLIVARMLGGDFLKIIMKYYMHHNIGALGLTVLYLCKDSIDLRSLVLEYPKFMRFLEKRLNFRKGISRETQFAFDVVACIVEDEGNTKSNPNASHSEEDRRFKDPAIQNSTISWELSSILPKLVYCGSLLSVSPINFISALLKQNLKSSFVMVEELTNKEPRELSDILTNIYLYVHDVLQKPQEPETEDSLWEAAYLILRYSSQYMPEGELEKSVVESERKFFMWNLIGEHVWSRLSLALKLSQMDANDLSAWSANFLWFIKQWLQGHHTILKDGRMKHEYFTEYCQDLSFVKIAVELFKKFRVYENNKTWPERREKVDKIYRRKIFLAHHVFVYCVIILKEFFAEIPGASSCLIYFQRSEQVLLTYIQNLDSLYMSKLRKIIS